MVPAGAFAQANQAQRGVAGIHTFPRHPRCVRAHAAHHPTVHGSVDRMIVVWRLGKGLWPHDATHMPQQHQLAQTPLRWCQAIEHVGGQGRHRHHRLQGQPTFGPVQQCVGGGHQALMRMGMVIGPSLTKCTFISVAKRPVCTNGYCSRASATKRSYSARA